MNFEKLKTKDEKKVKNISWLVRTLKSFHEFLKTVYHIIKEVDVKTFGQIDIVEGEYGYEFAIENVPETFAIELNGMMATVDFYRFKG